jgi:hypothetical protein
MTRDIKRTDIILTRTAVELSLIKCSILRIAVQQKITQVILVLTVRYAYGIPSAIALPSFVV